MADPSWINTPAAQYIVADPGTVLLAAVFVLAAAVVGLVIVLFAQVIVRFVLTEATKTT